MVVARHGWQVGLGSGGLADRGLLPVALVCWSGLALAWLVVALAGCGLSWLWLAEPWQPPALPNLGHGGLEMVGLRAGNNC